MLFSIIVPVYNSELYIRECVDSVLRQTFTDWELVLVDDGSNDDTPRVLDKYATDSRIVIFHIPNGGASNARNFGIKHSKGDYVVFLDADDYFKDDYLEKLAKAISSTRADIFFGSARTDYFGGSNFRDCTLFDCDIANVLDVSELPSFFLAYADDAPCACWHNVYSLDYLRNNDLYFDSDLVLSEDRDHLFKVLLSHPSFLCVNVFGYVHRVNNENSLTSIIDETKLIGSLHFVEKWMSFCRKGEMPRQFAPWLSRDYCRTICQSTRLDERKREVVVREALRNAWCLHSLVAGEAFSLMLTVLPFGRWAVMLGRVLNYITRSFEKTRWYIKHFRIIHSFAE